jgi:lysophospholipase L1-like esterase
MRKLILIQAGEPAIENFNKHFMRNNFGLILAVFMLIFSFNSIETQGQKKETTDKLIVMFGNSITFQGKWEEVLGRNDVLNCGIPGYTTGQLIWTIKNILKDHPGTKIWFLEGGINDISLGVPVNRVFENFKITIDSLKHNNIIPVVQSTILKNGDNRSNKLVTQLNKKIKKYCDEKQVDYIDLNRFLSTNGELIKELTTDGCHLQPNAYIPWGVEVKRVLAKYDF